MLTNNKLFLETMEMGLFGGYADVACSACGLKAEIVMRGYAADHSDIYVCKKCALQLARKLLEDVCDLEGDRHG